MCYMKEDAVLRAAAAYVQEENAQTLERYEQAAASEYLDCSPNSDFLQFARQYDSLRAERLKRERQRARCRCLARTIAICCICVVTLGSLTLDSSYATLRKAFNLLFDDEQGEVILHAVSPADKLADWNGYWYPDWLPEGFALIESEERDQVYTLLFAAEDMDVKLVISEYPLDSNIGVDTETTAREEAMVGDSYGQLFQDLTGDKEQFFLIWRTDANIMQIHMIGSDDTALLMAVAESMRYHEP